MLQKLIRFNPFNETAHVLKACRIILSKKIQDVKRRLKKSTFSTIEFPSLGINLFSFVHLQVWFNDALQLFVGRNVFFSASKAHNLEFNLNFGKSCDVEKLVRVIRCKKKTVFLTSVPIKLYITGVWSSKRIFPQSKLFNLTSQS